MEFVTKWKPVNYIKLGEKRFECSDVLAALDDMLATDEDAGIFGNCIKNYNLSAPEEIYDWLTSIGIVKKQTGERMATLYCMAMGGKKRIEQMINEIDDYIELDNESKTYEC